MDKSVILRICIIAVICIAIAVIVLVEINDGSMYKDIVYDAVEDGVICDMKVEQKYEQIRMYGGGRWYIGRGAPYFEYQIVIEGEYTYRAHITNREHVYHIKKIFAVPEDIYRQYKVGDYFSLKDTY